MKKEEILSEYIKCAKDTKYALKTFLETFDNTVKRYVPFELFQDQSNLIDDYETFNENIAVKYRQAGVSTATAGWVSKILAWAAKEKPEKVLIVANKLDTAVELANKIRTFLKQWPGWVNVRFDPDKDAARHYRLMNGCEVKAVATSKDALRGYTPTILIFDEAAHIEATDDFWAAAMASLSTGGKAIVISTPNGFDPIYYEVYDQSLRGLNNFKITQMYWYRDPRYTEDLSLIKVENIVDYLLRKEDYGDLLSKDYSKVPPKERDFNEIAHLISEGYKPTSSWFESMVKKFKFDKRLVSQELECDFLGSGDNVIDPKIVQYIKENQIKDPISKGMGGSLWIWAEPKKGHKYVLGADVSRGDSDDFSTIQIIDITEQEQVLEFVDKVPPDVLAEIIFKWGIAYGAFVVVDITGGMGVATARKLQELNYKNLYFDGIENSTWKYNSKIDQKVPGINFNNKRVIIISSFEEALRYRFKIYSKRLLNEINTFIYINGRPDHTKGKHDDLIMSIATAIFVSEISFGKIEKLTEQSKILLESWQVNERNVFEENDIKYFNPSLSFTDGKDVFRGNPTREQYNEYSWLFTNKKN